MSVDSPQWSRYQDHGFLLIEDALTGSELNELRDPLPRLFDMEAPWRVLEKDGQTVRSIYGSHTSTPAYQRIVRHPKILGAACAVLHESVYVYQFKINAKRGLAGDVWEWHQDFIFWHNEDGMLEPRAVNVAIFMDDVTEFNGPMIFVPGSHLDGMIDTKPKDASVESALAAALKYSIPKETLSRQIDARGLVAPKGRAGSVLLFHPDIVHASAPNMSPRDRMLIIVTYNAATNRLREVAAPRPEWLVARSGQELHASWPTPDHSVTSGVI